MGTERRREGKTRRGRSGRHRDSQGVGIIELSAQWSDGGGRVVPLMEEEMSFLPKLIVQKRAEPLFGRPCDFACTPFNQARRRTHRNTHTCRDVFFMTFGGITYTYIYLF